MEDRILTIDEVTAMTRVPKATLYRWRHSGDDGPRSFSMGRRVRYRESDVVAWIATQEYPHEARTATR